MIPLPGIRDKGGGQQLGATGPGTAGPYGWYGADEVDTAIAVSQDDDGLDDEQQHDHETEGR